MPEALNDSQFLCPRLTRSQLCEAIQLPALGAGGEVTDELAAQLINDAGANSDQLPLIQHALARLWYLTQSRRLTLEQYWRRYRRLTVAAETEATSGLLREPELSFLEKWWRDFAPARGVV